MNHVCECEAQERFDALLDAYMALVGASRRALGTGTVREETQRRAILAHIEATVQLRRLQRKLEAMA